MARAPRQRGEAAGHGAEADRGLHPPEHRNAAVVRAGDPRGERVPLRVHAQDAAGEDRDRDPHPRARAHLPPAVPKRLDDGLGRGVLDPDGPAGAGVDAEQQQRAQHERQGVEGERLTRAEAQHERGGQRRADEEREVRHRLGERPRILDLGLRHGLGEQAAVGRLEERLGGAEQRLDHDELPDRDRAGEDQHRDEGVQDRADRVRGDHDPVARQSIGPHPAEQEQADERQRLRAEHEPEVRGRARPLRDEDRDRHDDDPVADVAGGLTEEQVSEVGVAQDAEGLTHGSTRDGERRSGTARPSRGDGGVGRCQRSASMVVRS